MTDYQKILSIDFDGVIHSYDNGWKGIDIITDTPVKGAAGWLQNLIDDPDFKPVIYSSRSNDPRGIEAMKNYIRDIGVDPDDLEFPTEKPAAFMTIDDRAICFTGVFPTRVSINNFKAWNKK